jgi:tetratricopeptide (TPR) repeat protein
MSNFLGGKMNACRSSCYGSISEKSSSRDVNLLDIEFFKECPWTTHGGQKTNIGNASIHIESIDEGHVALLEERMLAGNYYRMVELGSEYIQAKLNGDNCDVFEKIESFSKLFNSFLREECQMQYKTGAWSRVLAAKDGFNCLSSAFLAFDIAEKIGFKDLKIITVPSHCVLKIGDFFLETTGGQVVEFQRINERYGSYTEYDKNTALAVAHYTHGVSLDNLGRYEEAIASYDRAIEIDPNHSNAHNNRGVSLDKLGRYEEAITSCDRAIEIEPNHSNAHHNHGVSLNNLGRYEEAIASYDRAIEIDPNHSNTHNDRGISLDNLGRYEEAIASYDRAIEIDPNNLYAHNNRGVSLSGLGRYEEAIASYDRAIEIDPNNLCVHNNRGVSLSGLGRYEEAIASYDRTIEIDPNNLCAHNNRKLSLAILAERTQEHIPPGTG